MKLLNRSEKGLENKKFSKPRKTSFFAGLEKHVFSKKIIFSLLIFGIMIMGGCKENCDSSLYTVDGKCCTYTCDLECKNGYKQGTCECECEEASDNTNEINDPGDTNIDDIFDDNNNIEPPSIPI